MRDIVPETVGRVAHLLQQEAAVVPGEVLVVAVSGGVDSTVLVDVLDRTRNALPLDLHVAHLDHQLRPDSAEDSRFVAALARSRGLPFTGGACAVQRLAAQAGLSLEAAARQARYEFLDQVARDQGARLVALGHHAADQAETVLLHLLRGSGAAGLAAMPVLARGRYLRPLLGLDRPHLEAYAAQANLSFREDVSNRDPRFLRNRLRHELLPVLRTYNPAVVQALGRTARILHDEEAYLEEAAGEALARVLRPLPAAACGQGTVVLDAPGFGGYHIAIQRRILRKLAAGLSTREGPGSFAQVERALEVARRPAGGLCALPCGLGLQRVGDLVILGCTAERNVDVELPVPGEVALAECGLRVRTGWEKGGSPAGLRLGARRAAFDALALGGSLRLRRPRPGDRFQPLGMAGRKKLSDFLIDAKWPRLLRDEVLLLTRCDGQIAWVVGMRPAEPFRVRPDSHGVVLVEVLPDDGAPGVGPGREQS
ncbi:MAG: tRNA lysidine(34) synthetase TilS, partial [Candidatus Latescibacterota bacterium]